MTGREVIDYILSNTNPDEDLYILINGEFVEIREVDMKTKRDPFDGDFDKQLGCIIPEE